MRFELGAVLARLGLLSDARGEQFEQTWDALRRQLRLLGESGGPQRVRNHVIAPLAHCMGYDAPRRQDEVSTREGMEDGGWLMHAPCGASLRAWSVGAEVDLDAPHRSGRAYRFSPTRSAQRVLLVGGERAGLLTNGDELRLLLCDPARPDSHITIPLAGAAGWRAHNLPPDSYRVLLALAAPNGLGALAGVLDAARLSQARITKDLRLQARNAIEGFLQAVLDHPANRRLRAEGEGLAARVWAEGLVVVYRLLFVLKLETASEPARAFSFASTNLWRNALSPNRALGPLVRRHLDQGTDTGRMLEDGLRLIFRVFQDGLSCSELSVAPLGGALFGVRSTPLLDALAWGERAVALLLDRLLWTMPKGRERERVHYGSLDVEDLGRIYEALLELEPGITTEPMARLRRAKLEVVLPLRRAAGVRPAWQRPDDRTGVTWVEDIAPNRFFLRAGLGRKTTGSYYTPRAFVRFLVRETLAPQVRARSRDDDPNPVAILALKVVDPATGSGHFLVEACRFLGEALYAACRLCDEQAEAAEDAARDARLDQRARLLATAEALRARVADLPDPDGTLLAYLPSRVSEGGESGVSQNRALAVCRRLVAVHSLYGVDRNMLAVELAKLSLWLESYGEGLPLTFLDHRLVHGDSLSGPFLAQLATLPVGGGPLDPLLAQGVAARLSAAVDAALTEVRALEATVGKDAADLVLKEAAKARLDATLAPLRKLASAWSGAVMLATREGNDEWLTLAQTVAATGAWPCALTERQAASLEAGSLALPWDLTFPEVFMPDGAGGRPGGFDAVLSNPPWDIMQQNTGEFLAEFDLSVLVLADRPQFVENSRYFRAACREIARSTDEHTAIAAILPPGVICGHTINVERRPSQRSNAAALTVVAVMNSFVFDWALRQKAAAHVSLYILAELPVPPLAPIAHRLLAHTSLRLTCNHRGFLPLWREQLGERSKPCFWPAVPTNDGRWRLRAAMDAVVANAYGLDRAEYEHILGSFSHKSFGFATEFCLAAFDRLTQIGLDAFCRDHDRYFDIPLTTALAKPVISVGGTSARQHNVDRAETRRAKTAD